MKSNTQKQANVGRRSFIWKVGAGVSAVLAATVPGVAKPLINNDKALKTSVGSLTQQVAILEDEKKIRALNKAYEDFLDKGMYGKVLDLFSDGAEVIFNGGLFKGSKGLDRLFCNYFKSGLTGKRIDQAPGFEVNREQQQDLVEIASDRKSAKARFAYSIQVGSPLESDSTLVQMARSQGEGIQKWWEGGVYELSYVKEAIDGVWKIKKLEFKTLSRADYKPGRPYAKPISVNQFSKVYPHEPAGPDRLVNQA